MLNELLHREQLGSWLNTHILTGNMAEIGVAFGGYAQTVLSQWQGKEYVMIDPWVKQPKEIYKEKTEGIPYDSWYQQCQELAKKDTRVKLIRKFSVEASMLFQDGYFDCVYLDGNHCAEAVQSDLEAWWPKVKKGGLFCGHDFYEAKTDGHYCEVKSVVEAWNKQFPPHVTSCTSWWILKL